MSRTKRPTPEGYQEEAARVAALFAALPRGARMRCAYDLRTPPIIISRVLSGKVVRPELLAKLETWAVGDPQ